MGRLDARASFDFYEAELRDRVNSPLSTLARQIRERATAHQSSGNVDVTPSKRTNGVNSLAGIPSVRPGTSHRLSLL